MQVVHNHRVALGVFVAFVLLSLSGAFGSDWVLSAPLSPADSPAGTGQRDGIVGLLGRLHPAAVHFPIALILMAGVAELLARRTRVETFGFVARFNLYAAAAMAVPAAVLGFVAASGSVFEGQQAASLSVHRIAGTAVPVLAVVTAGLAASAQRTQQSAQRGFYWVLLLLTVACVILAAYYGGLLTLGPEHFGL